MNGKTVMECIDAAYAALKEHTDEIAVLDQQIGDGDHIFNLLRGMEALLALRADIEGKTFGAALELAANKVLSTVGGSSGPLFFRCCTGWRKHRRTLHWILRALRSCSRRASKRSRSGVRRA